MRLGWGWALLVVPLVGCSGGDDADGSEAEATTTTSPVVELVERWGPAMADTPEGVLVWGGSGDVDGDGETAPLSVFEPSYFDDGALLDGPGTTGRRVAASPFEAPLRGVDATVVGDEVLVVGTTCAEAADVDSDQPECRPAPAIAVGLYDPAADRWRTVDLPPELRGDAAWSWIWTTGAIDDGKALVHVTHRDAPEIWTLDTTTGEWAVVDAEPSAGAKDCVTGDHYVQIASQLRLAVWDLADGAVTSRFSAELPEDARIDGAYADVVCTPDEVLLFEWGLETPIRRYDPATDTWTMSSTPAALPGDALRQLTKTAWTGSELLLLNTLDEEPGLAYDVDADTWRVLEPPEVGPRDWVPDEPLWTDAGLAMWTTDGLALLDVGA
jgi:hypothetical protein